ncbi:Methyltransf_23 domain-containing protein [Penicillium ucsense]|uniref:Methyltransf_23 domain-containing protein n=1 Tax=Penicillium ucsense TaxID=2839758 RepID=A0A8J8WCV4_9EURO|nr:Methyltransf_23 domain-containing protein [Penicillium ucsense]KAF7733537.1 Methyltransf_23 domain-containing protein [Penicillium ucsense]
MKTIQEMLAEKGGHSGSQSVQYLETVEAYDKWAEVYDTDGNFLQRLDTMEMKRLLPRFLECVYARFHDQPTRSERMVLLDLGCGTGRNTIQLLNALAGQEQEETASKPDGPPVPDVYIIGLDASPGMLKVARSAIDEAMGAGGAPATPEYTGPKVVLGTIDLLLQPAALRTQLPPLLGDTGAAGVICTLVLEHVPLRQFFQATSATMCPGGYLLLTNMHADMGLRSQAGFTDPQSGIKIRPTSYFHSIEEIVSAAEAAGFQMEDIFRQEASNGGVRERAIDEDLARELGPRARKWIGITVWFGVCFSKKTSER